MKPKPDIEYLRDHIAAAIIRANLGEKMSSILDETMEEIAKGFTVFYNGKRVQTLHRTPKSEEMK